MPRYGLAGWPGRMLVVPILPFSHPPPPNGIIAQVQYLQIWDLTHKCGCEWFAILPIIKQSNSLYYYYYYYYYEWKYTFVILLDWITIFWRARDVALTWATPLEASADMNVQHLQAHVPIQLSHASTRFGLVDVRACSPRSLSFLSYTIQTWPIFTHVTLCVAGQRYRPAIHAYSRYRTLITL